MCSKYMAVKLFIQCIFFLYQCIATFCPDDVQEFLMDCFISLLHSIMMMYETLLVCVLSKCGYFV